MTTLPIAYPHITIENNVAFVTGTRIPVRRIFAWHRQGSSVETLMKRYPQIGPARVLTALAFGYDHPDLMKLDVDVSAPHTK